MAYKYFKPPFELREPKTENGAANIHDADGNFVAMMYWPTHPVEETEAAEQETYALGRARAAVGAGIIPNGPTEASTRNGDRNGAH